MRLVSLAFPLLCVGSAILCEVTGQSPPRDSILRRSRRVIRGRNVPNPWEFPWAALIQGKFKADRPQICGASILNEMWIVTAAHCFDSPNGGKTKLTEPSSWHVSVGITNFTAFRNAGSTTNLSSTRTTTPTTPAVPTTLTPTPFEPGRFKIPFIKWNFPPSRGLQFTIPPAFFKVNIIARQENKLPQTSSRFKHGGRHNMKFPTDANEPEFVPHRMYNYFPNIHQPMKMKPVLFEIPEDNLEPMEVEQVTSAEASTALNGYPLPIVEGDSHHHYHVKKIIVHPNYKPRTLSHDIALMKLDRALPLFLRKHFPLRAIPLPVTSTTYPKDVQSCVMVGWGCQKMGGQPGPVAQMTYTYLRVWDHHKCNAIYHGNAGLEKDREFCAGYFHENVGICPGDSGSGLACFNVALKRWFLAGIASATHKTNPESYPAVFTRVAYFSQWLHTNMKSN